MPNAAELLTLVLLLPKRPCVREKPGSGNFKVFINASEFVKIRIRIKRNNIFFTQTHYRSCNEWKNCRFIRIKKREKVKYVCVYDKYVNSGFQR